MVDGDLERMLQASAVFGCLDDGDRRRLAAAGQRRHYKPRQTIFSKHDPGSFMLAVLAGCVRVCIYSSEGREIALNLIQPGEILGEIAVLDGRPRTADAVAIDTVEALVIDRRDLLALLEERPAAAVAMLAMLCQRLRRTSGQVEALAFHDLPSRLAMLLLRLADDTGVATTDGVRIARPLAQRDLARLIGSTRESVNRQLRSWSSADIIANDGGHITIRDREALALVADEAG